MLERAVKDAREKANIMAGALSCMLSEVSKINYSHEDIHIYSQARNIHSAAEAKASTAESLEITPDDLVISDDVTVEWVLVGKTMNSIDCVLIVLSYLCTCSISIRYMSRKPQIDKLMTGLAGEYLVAAKMNLRGWVASLTLKNYPGVDIFGMNPLTGQTIEIQVKSCWDSSFFVGVKHSERDQMPKKIKGPFVFVHMDSVDSASFYILTKKEFIGLVNSSDDAYFNKPRKKPIKPDYPIALFLHELKPYQDHWDSLWK